MTRPFTSVAVMGIIYFGVAIVSLHFLRSALNPLSHPTSEYAVGKYGWLMTSAFFSVSIASFALVIALSKSLSAGRSRIGLVLLTVWAVGVLVAMVFPIDPDGANPTTSGKIHRINGPITFLSLTFGALLVSASLFRDKDLRSVSRQALTLSLLMLASFILTIVNIVTDSGFAGLCQRVFLVFFIAWFIVITLHLRSVPPKAEL